MRVSQSNCEDAPFAVARAPGTVVLLAWCAAATHFDTSSAMRPFRIFSGFGGFGGVRVVRVVPGG